MKAERDYLLESYRIKSRFPHLQNYPSLLRLKKNMDFLLQHESGITILDYGCGRGETSLNYLQSKQNKFIGIDLSPVYIEDARLQAIKEKIPAEFYEFQVMDAHHLKFPDHFFELVVGSGILHHLNLEIALNEVFRVLKPGGKALFLEPLAGNPLLKTFRKFTPRARTEEEKPITTRQIKLLSSQPDWNCSFQYCGVLEMPFAMLSSYLFPKNIENPILGISDKVESWLNKNGFFCGWNQYVLLQLCRNG